MSMFKEVERIEDEATLNREKHDGLTEHRLKQVKSCEYRVPGDVMYSVKCLHPDRTKGRHCVNLNCPLLYRVV